MMTVSIMVDRSNELRGNLCSHIVLLALELLSETLEPGQWQSKIRRDCGWWALWRPICSAFFFGPLFVFWALPTPLLPYGPSPPFPWLPLSPSLASPSVVPRPCPLPSWSSPSCPLTPLVPFPVFSLSSLVSLPFSLFLFLCG